MNATSTVTINFHDLKQKIEQLLAEYGPAAKPIILALVAALPLNALQKAMINAIINAVLLKQDQGDVPQQFQFQGAEATNRPGDVPCDGPVNPWSQVATAYEMKVQADSAYHQVYEKACRDCGLMC